VRARNWIRRGLQFSVAFGQTHLCLIQEYFHDVRLNVTFLK